MFVVNKELSINFESRIIFVPDTDLHTLPFIINRIKLLRNEVNQIVLVQRGKRIFFQGGTLCQSFHLLPITNVFGSLKSILVKQITQNAFELLTTLRLIIITSIICGCVQGTAKYYPCFHYLRLVSNDHGLIQGLPFSRNFFV